MISRQQINISNNNSEDSSFLVRAAFQTLDDGQFGLKHSVKHKTKTKLCGP
jgi:hypothetical protein